MSERRATTTVQPASLLGKGTHALRNFVDQILLRNQKVVRAEPLRKGEDSTLDAPQKLSAKAASSLQYPNPKMLPKPRVRPSQPALLISKKRALANVEVRTVTHPVSLQSLHATAPSPHLPLFAQSGRVFFCK